MPTLPLPDASAGSRLSADMDSFHDSAAVLVCGGRVIAGVEEERLNRLKHTNKIAVRAIRACLEIAGLTLDDISRFAYYGREDLLDRMIVSHMIRHPEVPAQWTARAYFAAVLSQELGCEIDPARLAFVEHHLAHAVSAYCMSSFTDALVVTLDGHGDGLAGTVWAGQAGRLNRLFDIPERDSLGFLYLYATRYLGYGLFDEYKVMGLAPYGDPRRFRRLLEPVCSLEPGGKFKIDGNQLARALRELPAPRRRGEPLTSLHHDVAAAMQDLLERATLHMLAHYRQETRLPYLCLAGGVAHNSTMVGKVARSGLFEGVFVQPAAHDAGCALGAALSVHRDLAGDVPIAAFTDVYWGPNLGDDESVRGQLAAWSDLVHFERVTDIAAHAAGLLADGAVLGWVQGRSEFGPRALGNRSILADPRPASNRDRINDLVKQREAYRPFAPAVLEEEAGQFFDLPPGASAAFMTLTAPVREHMRGVLGAVTHVDGTARVQTVSRSANARFWALLEAFRVRTGIPVLLNTSFNHSVEPIVDSIDDAVTSFLTTGLSHLAVGDYLVTKREGVRERLSTLVPVLPDHIRLTHARQADGKGRFEDMFRCEHTVMPSRTRTLSRAAHRLLRHCDGRRSVAELFSARRISGERAAVTGELEELWAYRLLRLIPPRRDAVKSPARPCQEAVRNGDGIAAAQAPVK